MLGKSIGRYQIVEELGAGGMAVVYKAYDTHLETDVALKVIRQDWGSEASGRKMLARFESEAKRVARLSHPNIIPILDYGEYDKTPFLVMKYIPGGTLKDRMGHPTPWRDALRLLLPVARALSYAHQQGIIHRDVKPANILLTETGEPMLSDFGIAKMALTADTSQEQTAASLVIGTPEYMAPEQALGKAVDQRIDIYALGLVLYEMISGRTPFKADTPVAMIMKQISEPPPPLRQQIPDLPEAVEKLILKALAKDPEERFQTMAACCAAMDQVAQTEAHAARPAPPPVEAGARAPEMNPPEKASPVKSPPIPVRAATLKGQPESSPPPSAKPPVPSPIEKIPARPAPAPEQAKPAATPTAGQPKLSRRTPVLILLGIAGGLGVVCLLILAGMAIFSALPGKTTPTAVAAASTLNGVPTDTATAPAAVPVPSESPTGLTPAAEGINSQTTALVETERAGNRQARTATAQAHSTVIARGMYDQVRSLNLQGVLDGLSGTYHALDDFNENWAQLGWYKWWNTGYQPKDFVIRAHTTWESASQTADWFNTGCGFVFRARDKDNHYVIFLALDGNVYWKGYIDGTYRELGKEYAQTVERVKGEADVMLAVEGSRVTYYVNDSQVLQKENKELSDPGDLAYTLVSGTNKEFGTRCTMTNVELWELDSR